MIFWFIWNFVLVQKKWTLDDSQRLLDRYIVKVEDIILVKKSNKAKNASKTRWVESEIFYYLEQRTSGIKPTLKLPSKNMR